MRNCLAILSILAVSLFALTGCQSVKKIEGTSKGYSTFRFIDMGPSGDDRFEEPAAEKDQVAQSAIREIFEANGLTYSTDDADLMIAYLFIRQNNVSTMVVPTYYGLEHDKIQSYAHKKGVIKGEQRESFDNGAIVIDIIELDSQKLIYRDWSVRDVRGVSDKDEKIQLVEDVIAESLARFFE